MLVQGEADGETISTIDMISFWEGFNPFTGMVIDQHHPLVNQSLCVKS